MLWGLPRNRALRAAPAPAQLNCVGSTWPNWQGQSCSAMAVRPCQPAQKLLSFVLVAQRTSKNHWPNPSPPWDLLFTSKFHFLLPLGGNFLFQCQGQCCCLLSPCLAQGSVHQWVNGASPGSNPKLDCLLGGFTCTSTSSTPCTKQQWNLFFFTLFSCAVVVKSTLFSGCFRF